MSSYNSTPEAEFEHAVVKKLASGQGQWRNRSDLKDCTEKQLWNNFFNILTRHNYSKLQGIPLTTPEKHQVERQIENINSPYEAAKLLEGENGVGKVTISRNNVKLGDRGRVDLDIFYKADVGAGKSVYEVVEQPRRKPKRTIADIPRRFDVTLLINGLPLIQLELKKSTVNLHTAFNQIEKYAEEGMYGGIFSLLQMFVIMTPDSSAYFANCKPGHFNPAFEFNWRDNHNRKIENGLDFTDQVLNIPMAHEMVSEYTVIDEERKQLILLRPYQIYAIRAIMKRIRQHQNGFIWHTMGSGKTLTSYKTAKLAAQQPNVCRTLFVVDRKALDRQTTGNFQAYARNDDMDVENTNRTSDLVKKMCNDDNQLIVTSIQKLHRAVLEQKAKVKSGSHNKFSKLFNKRIVFFVDEIQRSQFGKMRRDIGRAFPNSNWYGYTGTPIFKQNAKKVGDQLMTTESLFGKVCHPIYNIRIALDDGAVLPFNVEHVSTLSDDPAHNNNNRLRKRVVQLKENQFINKHKTFDKNKLIDKVASKSLAELEDKFIPSSTYDNGQHVMRVVDYIMKYGSQKTSQGKGNFNAILATSSISMALKYYDTFKKVKANSKLMNKYKNFRHLKHYYCPSGYPNIAVTYSLQADTDPDNKLHEKTVKVLKDYNNQYCDGHNTFTMDNLDTYNVDVAKRTARRDPNYSNLLPSHQINLVIVVDRLLTGFDAPRMNTLFVDKLFSQPQQLIQAYSRTNRLQGGYKQEGQIVTFRKPHLMKQDEKNAYLLYGGEGSFNIIMKPNYFKASQKFKDTVRDLKQIAPTADSVDKLAGANDKVKFVKIFSKMIKRLNSLSMYSNFSWHNGKKKFGIAEGEVEHYIGKYNAIKNEVRNDLRSGHGNNKLDDLDFSVSVGSATLVNYDYITRLIEHYVSWYQQYIVKSDDDLQKNMPEFIKLQADIQKYIKEYSQSGHLNKAKLLKNELHYAIQQIDKAKRNHVPVTKNTASALMFQYRNHQYVTKLENFANKYKVSPDALDRVAREHGHNSSEWKDERLLLSSISYNGSGIDRIMYIAKVEKKWRYFINNVLDIYLDLIAGE